MAHHKVLILFQQQISDLGKHIQSFFEADSTADVDEAVEMVSSKDYKAVVFDTMEAGDLDIELCESVLSHAELIKLPVVILTRSYSLQDKLKAFDIGFDDFIDGSITKDEVCARITKSIFHRIATDQLSSRLEMANQTARSALVDNSDLGANIQFLLSVHSCDNLDQLGQQFFATIERYGLHCSLQMRSIMGEKNMEAHGMAKDLESQLLTQLKGSDRYIDFGKRTIINFDRVSLLIKNMPIDDAEKYGSIKDNTFSLIQGMNARIIALEDKHRLLEERESLRKLSKDVQVVMMTLQESYQTVMNQIATEVENMSELVQARVPSFALTEGDENFLYEITDQCVTETNRVFNDGLKVDECFSKLEYAVARTLAEVDEAAELSRKVSPMPIMEKHSTDNTIELF
ncbi:DNA-binding response regulator [Teredinibacter sp. KSP-S5-2]|uniref:DNA-binding response regulator n=1 Tax=Teredinibacter sp. KSP-S5-2 TaxID=3034506 RepID=UPI0029343F00|nr:DNA-binding response regulator [Teredinibacter sp. KSP-S5-2]WNO10146.1 DNA-binding response regulator [Teredinibacter sp. KSP-S5-2]